MKSTWSRLKFTPRQIGGIVALVSLCVVIGISYKFVDVPSLHARAEKFDGMSVFAFLAVLPLIGFPVTILHAIAGVRFGPWHGVMIVAAATIFHLCASYGLVRAMPNFFAQRLKTLRNKIPPGAHGPVTLFTLLIPGAPYWAINYVLPLIGVRFWVFLGIALPMHLARSMISIYVGDVSDRLTPGRIAVVGVYWVVVLTGCALSWRWLQKRLGDPPPRANGQKLAV